MSKHDELLSSQQADTFFLLPSGILDDDDENNNNPSNGDAAMMVVMEDVTPIMTNRPKVALKECDRPSAVREKALCSKVGTGTYTNAACPTDDFRESDQFTVGAKTENDAIPSNPGLTFGISSFQRSSFSTEPRSYAEIDRSVTATQAGFSTWAYESNRGSGSLFGHGLGSCLGAGGLGDLINNEGLNSGLHCLQSLSSGDQNLNRVSPWGAPGPQTQFTDSVKGAANFSRPPPGFDRAGNFEESEYPPPPFLFSLTERTSPVAQRPIAHRTLFGGTTYVVPEEGEDFFNPAPYDKHRSPFIPDSSWNRNLYPQYSNNEMVYESPTQHSMDSSPRSSSIPRNVNVILKDDTEEASVISFLSDTTMQTQSNSTVNLQSSPRPERRQLHESKYFKLDDRVSFKMWKNQQNTSLTVVTPTIANLKDRKTNTQSSKNTVDKTEKLNFSSEKKKNQKKAKSSSGYTFEEETDINVGSVESSTSHRKKKEDGPKVVKKVKGGGLYSGALKSQLPGPSVFTHEKDKMQTQSKTLVIQKGKKKSEDGFRCFSTKSIVQSILSVTDEVSEHQFSNETKSKKFKRKKRKGKMDAVVAAPITVMHIAPSNIVSGPVVQSEHDKSGLVRQGWRRHSQIAGQNSSEAEGNTSISKRPLETWAAASKNRDSDDDVNNRSQVYYNDDEESLGNGSEEQNTDSLVDEDEGKDGACVALSAQITSTVTPFTEITRKKEITEDEEVDLEDEDDISHDSESKELVTSTARDDFSHDTEIKDMITTSVRLRLESNTSSIWDAEDYHSQITEMDSRPPNSSMHPRIRSETGDSSSLASSVAAANRKMNASYYHPQISHKRSHVGGKRLKNRRNRQRGCSSAGRSSSIVSNSSDYDAASISTRWESIIRFKSALFLATIWIWSNLGLSKGYIYLRSIPYRSTLYRITSSLGRNGAEIFRWAAYLTWDGATAFVSFLILLHKLALKEVIQNQIGFICYTFCTSYRSFMLLLGKYWTTPYWFPQLLWIFLVSTAVCWGNCERLPDNRSKGACEEVIHNCGNKQPILDARNPQSQSTVDPNSSGMHIREECSVRKRFSRKNREQTIHNRDSCSHSKCNQEHHHLPFPTDIMWPVSLLKLVRLCVIVLWSLETVTSTNQGIIMDLTGSEQVLTGFSLATIKMGYMLSPIAWISWSIQVLIMSFWKSSFVLEHCLLVMGLATLHIIHKVADRSVMIEATDGGIRLELGDKCGLIGGGYTDSRFGLVYSTGIAHSAGPSAGRFSNKRDIAGETKPGASRSSKNRRRLRTDK